MLWPSESLSVIFSFSHWKDRPKEETKSFSSSQTIITSEIFESSGEWRKVRVLAKKASWEGKELFRDENKERELKMLWPPLSLSVIFAFSHWKDRPKEETKSFSSFQTIITSEIFEISVEWRKVRVLVKNFFVTRIKKGSWKCCDRHYHYPSSSPFLIGKIGRRKKPEVFLQFQTINGSENVFFVSAITTQIPVDSGCVVPVALSLGENSLVSNEV